MPSDAELLRRFAETRDNDAFTEIVGRHIDFVFATALRCLSGDDHLASDVTQLVFVNLARKSAAVASHPVLGGWLHTSTRFAATQLVRAEQRRRHREQDAQTMIEANQDDSPAAEWNRLQPLLDDVLGQLKARERDAVLLRFFEGCAFAEIGARLNLTETAARSCVDRALDKMQGLLAQRGVTSTGVALGTLLASRPAIAAPTGLSSAVSHAAIMSTATIGTGSAILLTMSKLKTATVAAVVLAGLGTTAVQVRATLALRARASATGAWRDAMIRERTEADRLNAALRQLGMTNPEAAELAKLHGRAEQLRARPDRVVDAEIHAPRNVGRATPEAAIETYSWALYRRDVDTIASFISFSDDTAENREIFLSHFSAAIRNRYPTPERIIAAGLAAYVPQRVRSPDDGMQVYQVSPNWRPGTMDIQIWIRNNGREFAADGRYVQTPNGWAEHQLTLTNERFSTEIARRFDPTTGEPRPPPTATAGN